jgi:predicted acetyltransferase
VTENESSQPLAPPTEPVELVEVDRSYRAVLQNLGQLYRYDLSEPYRHLPNADGTFNNRRLDRFLAGVDPHHRTWLITAAGRLGGYVMVVPDDGAMTIADFFVVRALRRAGVGRAAARLVIAQFPGPWSIGFQPYNPGAQRFWSSVAAEFVGDGWELVPGPPVPGRPPDAWIRFVTR